MQKQRQQIGQPKAGTEAIHAQGMLSASGVTAALGVHQLQSASSMLHCVVVSWWSVYHCRQPSFRTKQCSMELSYCRVVNTMRAACNIPQCLLGNIQVIFYVPSSCCAACGYYTCSRCKCDQGTAWCACNCSSIAQQSWRSQAASGVEVGQPLTVEVL